MIVVKRDFAWFSAGLAFLAIVFSQGIDITLGRTTFLNVYELPMYSIILNILASIFLAFNKGYYIYAIPISFLSYLIHPELISIIIFGLALTAVKGIPTFARDVLLGIDAFGIIYVLLALMSIKINFLLLPIMAIQAGTPILIPLVLIFGILYGLKRDTITETMKFPITLTVLITLLITTLPLTAINSLGKSETVDWIYYASWISSPSVGWFFFSRPLYLVLLYPFGKLIGPDIVSQWQIPVLSLIFIFSAYKLGNSVKEGLGPLAALLAGVSPTLLTFLYSGLQANFFSLSMIYLSLAYLLRQETGRAILFSYLSLLSHVYAWAQLEGGIVIFIITYYLMKRELPAHFRRYTLFTGLPLVLGLVVMFMGILPVPLGFSVNSYMSQITVLSWGTINAFLYYAISVYGLTKSPRLIYVIFASSVLATLVLGVVQNLIIDIPLFIPASLGVLKLNSKLRIPVLVLFVIWALIMSLNSFPYLYNGVTI
ncbi:MULTISPECIES: hypothetical protein [Metallosphaera]|nr:MULTISPECIES: hypothetical protein [Metallosphaera]MCY0861598.1 hypothetical protein [Metallosphaera prunae]QCO31063.1 hypothetical protein DFR88_11660 [Metallosphaera prunae]BBL47441.1 hypothetical protein MJ1HA_1542 [Metallosphaera sedula]